MPREYRKGFFAYPSDPVDCGSAIEEAILQINETHKNISLKSWRSLDISGNLIISKILNEIDSCDFVCADITGINENVLFELGFAIGKKKTVWIFQDDSIAESYNRFRELNFLTTVGYSNYSQTSDIVDAFAVDKMQKKSNCLLDQFILASETTANKKAILFLKSQVDTNYNQRIWETIDYLNLPAVVDDAVEEKVQPLSWYISHLLNVPSVLIEFSSNHRIGHELQNSKCSFIAGLALGMGLKIQMVAAKPFEPSLDYQEYLKTFTNTESCKLAILPFLNNVKANLPNFLLSLDKRKDNIRQESKLQKLKFGEYIAEHEEGTELYEYYINTAHDQNLIKSEYNIVVGRKGTGKTATLYYLDNSLNKDVRNVVIPIKPINFEIDGLIELIKGLKSDFETGFIIQSIWKFLIYTEVAKSIYLLIKEKPIYALTDSDEEIIAFIEENKEIILTDFSSRLEQELINLELLKNIDEQTEFRNKLSEILHEKIIGRLRDLIISYMHQKKKLVILIDNLDKNWRKGNNIEIISKFILGLLSVVGRVAKDLKGNPKRPNDFGLNLIIFIRSDIFKYILFYSREPDKIEYYRLRWNDPEVLFRMLDKRLELLSDDGLPDAAIFWENYIVKRVDGMETKDYILGCTIPRPRDLIYFLNSAKSIAVSRGHTKIEESDLKSGYEDYSNWVFKSIKVENSVTINQIETFLYKVMGEDSVLTKSRLIELMKISNIPTEEQDIESFINHLCSITFLGREVKQDQFAFEFDVEGDEKILALADKYNSDRFKIHKAFIPYLECSDYVR